MKVLVISPTPTHPTNAGNRNCILSYCELISSFGYDVEFLWVKSAFADAGEDEAMHAYWKEKLHQFNKKSIQRVNDSFYWRLRFNRTGNYKVDDLFPIGLNSYLSKLLEEKAYDCVIVNYIFLSKCFNVVKKGVHKILYTHDVFTERNKKSASNWFSTTAAEEAMALNRAETIWAIQENEAAFYYYLSNRQVVTTYSYFPMQATPFMGNKKLLYLAGSNPHNIEAINHFIRNDFTEILNIFPDVKLLIGGTISSKVQAIDHPNIEIYGPVDDIENFYALGDIFINPTHSGTGLKIKTFEALARGKVMICHPHNVEGVYKKDLAPILVAQNGSDYVKHLNSLLNNAETIKAYKDRAMAYMAEFNKLVSKNIKNSLDSPSAVSQPQ